MVDQEDAICLTKLSSPYTIDQEGLVYTAIVQECEQHEGDEEEEVNDLDTFLTHDGERPDRESKPGTLHRRTYTGILFGFGVMFCGLLLTLSVLVVGPHIWGPASQPSPTPINWQGWPEIRYIFVLYIQF
jgi:hypothetical protein